MSHDSLHIVQPYRLTPFGRLIGTVECKVEAPNGRERWCLSVWE